MPARSASTRFPSRFRDPSRSDRLLWWERVYYGGDPRPSPEQAAELGRLLLVGDPLADALIDHWLASPGGFGAGRKELDLALERGIDAVPNASAPLVAFFDHIERIPLWLDREALELGRQSGARVGIGGSYVLGCVALMGGYRFSATTKPLVFTGALERKTARRLDETAKFVCDVYAPGGLDRFGPGFVSTVRVRVMHALVRHAASRSTSWRTEDWGLPINQADMLGTNLLFSVVYLIGLRALGLRFTRQEADGVMHMWRYVGYLMGVQEEILPATEREGRRISYSMFKSQPGADDDSRRLAKALAEAPLSRAKTPRERALIGLDTRFRLGLSRALLGPAIADELALPDDVWKYAIALIMPPTFAVETLRRRVPGLTRLAVRVGERSLASLSEAITKAEAVRFVPDVGHAHSVGVSSRAASEARSAASRSSASSAAGVTSRYS